MAETLSSNAMNYLGTLSPPPIRRLDWPGPSDLCVQYGDTSRRPASVTQPCNSRDAGSATPTRFPLRRTSNRTHSSGSCRMACASTSYRPRLAMYVAYMRCREQY